MALLVNSVNSVCVCVCAGEGQRERGGCIQCLKFRKYLQCDVSSVRAQLTGAQFFTAIFDLFELFPV
jgi:hypothetical protein